MSLFFDKVNKCNPDTFIVMAGDIHQIESIDFGNWFYYAKDIIQARGASLELLSTWRTNDQNLISLWDEVRKKDVCINEKLALLSPYTTDIGPEVLRPEMEDEVILCLNYDGKLTVFCMPNKEQLIAQVERVLDKWKSLGEAT